MKSRFNLKHSPKMAVVLSVLFYSQFIAFPALADWSSEKLYTGYNQSYGSFPPIDIDQQLEERSNTIHKNAVKQSQKKTVQTNQTTMSHSTSQQTTRQAPSKRQAPNYPAQSYTQPTYQGNYQQPARSGFYQGANSYAPYNQQYNQNTRYNPPRSNHSGFSMPWGNNRSGFRGPWDNSRTSFNGPWDNNNHSGFIMPWSNGNGWGW